MVTSLEKFVFASHLRKPKICNKARDFPKPITSQTLLIDGAKTTQARVCVIAVRNRFPRRELSGKKGRHRGGSIRDAFTEIGKEAWLFAKLQPGRARKRINAT